MDGYGKFTRVDGKTYSGQWENNMKHGQGRMEFPNGFSVEGTFVNDFCIQGKMRYSNGNMYIGDFLTTNNNTQPHGQGTYQWVDGSTYKGYWNKGKVDGKGLYTDRNGIEWNQVWKNGKKISSTKRVAENRSGTNNQARPAIAPSTTPQNQTPSGRRWKKPE